MVTQHSVVTIGVFDGVHLGHQALTQQAALVAAEFNLLPIAATFNPHPMSVVRGMQIPALVSMQRRVDLLRGQGMHDVYVCDFNLDRANQTPLQFINDVLINKLHAKHVVVGKGFRFGKGAAGSADDFRAAGLHVHEVEHVSIHGARVSSTRIREAVTEGNVHLAEELLSRPHRVEGRVVRGHQRGRALGFPTANLEYEFAQCIPADGVYAGWLRIVEESGELGHQWPAAVSVGTNPTFDDVHQRVVEAYAIGQKDLDLYGKLVAVDFVERVRPMVAFDSMPALIEAMNADVRTASQILGLN